MRIHILGPSGAGTTTLGQGLAARHGLAFFDVDDFFWQKTDPPFQTKTDRAERTAALKSSLDQAGSWVLSGSCLGWGDFVRPLCDLIIWLQVPASVRLERLAARETSRHGNRILPGGDMWQAHQDFLAWAAAYDTGDMHMRSRTSEGDWIARADCLVLECALVLPPVQLVDFISVLAEGLKQSEALLNP